MTSVSSDPPAAPRKATPSGLVLTAAGIAAAFGAAACCALPLLLAGAGLGTAWLGGVALIAAPHRPILLVAAAALLVAGAAVLWRQHRAARACAVDGACARPAYRLATLVGLLLGAGLLGLGYVYG